MATKLAEKTLAAAKIATNEAEFRIPFQAAIAEAAQSIGAPIQPRTKLSLIEGRADTVYNRLRYRIRAPWIPEKLQQARQ